jgi:Phage tail protein
VLTEVKAYSSWQSAPTLPLSDQDTAETDLIQVTNIDGLDPVTASVNTSPLGSVDGTSYVGSSVPSRNIVMTLHPNPDWDTWTYENLRKLLYSYFMPKRRVKLVFLSDDRVPVQIEGYVESVQANLFSKSPEVQVSIICPDPYFTSVDPIVVTGLTVRKGGAVQTVEYNGTIETGFNVEVTYGSGAPPTVIGIQIGDPLISFFNVTATVSATSVFEMNSVQMQKYVQNVDLTTGVISSLLSKVVQEGSAWPTLQPGENEFSVITDVGVQDWTLTYFERYGGL